tara:strand:- start:883 stop:1296 length:414 start_codon:yes stop_codon:yes gene_type:complete
MKNIFIYLTITVIFCNCNNKEDYIQDVLVDFNINLSLPEYNDLTALGSHIFVEGGNKGIVIYHFAINEYKAYDRNCSYEPSLACSYIDSVNSSIAYCNCCTSAFLLDQEGVAINSPALLPLKQYNTNLNNQNLYIYN